MRYKNFLFIVSFITIFMGVSMMLCIPFAVYYDEPAYPFCIPALLLMLSGYLFYRASNKKQSVIQSNRDGVIVITLSWLILVLAGMLPYLFSGTIPSLVDVFYETVSGLTSTGSTIFANIEAIPKSILFWRSLTHWIGGLATIVLLFTIVPRLNIGGYELFLFRKKNTDQFRHVIFQIVLIYSALTSLQVLLLFVGGMNLFESLCHSFGTVSTGSFSPKNDSIAGYSPYLQYVMSLFMFLSGLSYLVYFQIITGRLKKTIRNEENWIYFAVVFIVSLLFTEVIHLKEGSGFWAAYREGLFQVTSFVSSSGYYTTNYLIWPTHILPLVYLLIFIGGSAGSASGGIKIARLSILFKNLAQQFKIPDFSSNIKYNRSKIDESVNRSVLTFVTVFGFLFVSGTILVSFFETKLEKSAFLVLSALSTYGNNLVSVNFPDVEKLILSFLMIIGRLEIYPLFLLTILLFNRKERSSIEKKTAL